MLFSIIPIKDGLMASYFKTGLSCLSCDEGAAVGGEQESRRRRKLYAKSQNSWNLVKGFKCGCE